MPKVYVPQLPRRRDIGDDGRPILGADGKPTWTTIDITLAAVYGFLQEPVFPQYGITPMTKEVVAQARTAMKDYDPEEDSIIAIGDPCAIALLTTAAALEHRKYSLLRWDNRIKQYVKLSFHFKY